MSREDAYALVQAAAMATWQSGVPFRETLRAQAASRDVKIDEDRLDEICTPGHYVRRLGEVFDRLEKLV
jgi:adenylosuccinate lyase